MPRRPETSGFKDPHFMLINGKRVTAAELYRQVSEGENYFYTAQLRRSTRAARTAKKTNASASITPTKSAHAVAPNEQRGCKYNPNEPRLPASRKTRKPTAKTSAPRKAGGSKARPTGNKVSHGKIHTKVR